MSDFRQEGIITTLHALYETFDREEYLANLERRLEEHSRHLCIGLLLPCHYAEIANRKVLDPILDEIENVRYLCRVVVALGGASDEAQFREAKAYFERLRMPERDVKVVWVDGPRVQEIFEMIKERKINTGVPGKGQSVWMTLGYFFAQEDCDVVALHDCDILTYDRILLGRLIEPTANPNTDFEFCKGYYVRISPAERAMKGRVTRLFVTPLVNTLVEIMHDRKLQKLEEFFNYHRSFNYPLAGEFSFSTRLAREMNIAYDWGLEVATLSEIYHRIMPRKVAQIDLIPNYEHKHQEISPGDKSKGLHRMVVDIAKFYLYYLRSHGVSLDDSFVDMILHTYYQKALMFIKRYSEDADVNGLAYDRYQEELIVQYFRGFLWTAWEEIRGPHESTLIPSWNRVLFSLPDIYGKLLEAVDVDNA
jgi:glucosyl-3-phosphoglycerate synthase